MRILAASGCCIIWSGLHHRVIGEAIDDVAWTAARLCENWWTKLQTLARIIWTLLDTCDNLTFMCRLRTWHWPTVWRKNRC